MVPVLLALAFGLSALAADAATDPLGADALPEDLLAECDAAAASYGYYEPAIAGSVAALTAIGALTPEDFDGVRIGFCPMRRAGGPVGATSCSDDIILLDEKYRDAGEALVLHATLAHEMRHVRQHRAKKARAGEAWCESAKFLAEKPALEAAADAFGDAAAALIAFGRDVEIVNDCDAPLLVYLEADDPVAAAGAPVFERVAARGRAIARERAASGRVGYYAQTATKPPRIFEDPKSAQSRYVEGRLIRIRKTRLAAPDRLTSPFPLHFSCSAGAN